MASKKAMNRLVKMNGTVASIEPSSAVPYSKEERLKALHSYLSCYRFMHNHVCKIPSSPEEYSGLLEFFVHRLMKVYKIKSLTDAVDGFWKDLELLSDNTSLIDCMQQTVLKRGISKYQDFVCYMQQKAVSRASEGVDSFKVMKDTVAEDLSGVISVQTPKGRKGNETSEEFSSEDEKEKAGDSEPKKDSISILDHEDEDDLEKIGEDNKDRESSESNESLVMECEEDEDTVDEDVVEEDNNVSCVFLSTEDTVAQSASESTDEEKRESSCNSLPPNTEEKQPEQKKIKREKSTWTSESLFETILRAMSPSAVRQLLVKYTDCHSGCFPGQHVCHVCSFSTFIEMELWKHMLTSHVDWQRTPGTKDHDLRGGPFFCLHCGKKSIGYARIELMQWHDLCMHGLKHSCFFCGKVFLKVEEVTRRLKMSCCGATFCASCGKKFMSYKNLQHHVKQTHVVCERKKIPQYCQFGCHYCDDTFTSTLKLYQHMVSEHQCEMMGYRCRVCYQNFHNVVGLNSHLSTHLMYTLGSPIVVDMFNLSVGNMSGALIRKLMCKDDSTSWVESCNKIAAKHLLFKEEEVSEEINVTKKQKLEKEVGDGKCERPETVVLNDKKNKGSSETKNIPESQVKFDNAGADLAPLPQNSSEQMACPEKSSLILPGQHKPANAGLVGSNIHPTCPNSCDVASSSQQLASVTETNQSAGNACDIALPNRQLGSLTGTNKNPGSIFVNNQAGNMVLGNQSNENFCTNHQSVNFLAAANQIAGNLFVTQQQTTYKIVPDQNEGNMSLVKPLSDNATLFNQSVGSIPPTNHVSGNTTTFKSVSENCHVTNQQCITASANPVKGNFCLTSNSAAGTLILLPKHMTAFDVFGNYGLGNVGQGLGNMGVGNAQGLVLVNGGLLENMTGSQFLGGVGSVSTQAVGNVGTFGTSQSSGNTGTSELSSQREESSTAPTNEIATGKTFFSVSSANHTTGNAMHCVETMEMKSKPADIEEKLKKEKKVKVEVSVGSVGTGQSTEHTTASVLSNQVIENATGNAGSPKDEMGGKTNSSVFTANQITANEDYDTCFASKVEVKTEPLGIKELKLSAALVGKKEVMMEEETAYVQEENELSDASEMLKISEIKIEPIDFEGEELFGTFKEAGTSQVKQEPVPMVTKPSCSGAAEKYKQYLHISQEVAKKAGLGYYSETASDSGGKGEKYSGKVVGLDHTVYSHINSISRQSPILGPHQGMVHGSNLTTHWVSKIEEEDGCVGVTVEKLVDHSAQKKAKRVRKKTGKGKKAESLKTGSQNDLANQTAGSQAENGGILSQPGRQLLNTGNSFVFGPSIAQGYYISGAGGVFLPTGSTAFQPPTVCNFGSQVPVQGLGPNTQSQFQVSSQVFTAPLSPAIPVLGQQSSLNAAPSVFMQTQSQVPWSSTPVAGVGVSQGSVLGPSVQVPASQKNFQFPNQIVVMGNTGATLQVTPPQNLVQNFPTVGASGQQSVGKDGVIVQQMVLCNSGVNILNFNCPSAPATQVQVAVAKVNSGAQKQQSSTDKSDASENFKLPKQKRRRRTKLEMMVARGELEEAVAFRMMKKKQAYDGRMKMEQSGTTCKVHEIKIESLHFVDQK